MKNFGLEKAVWNRIEKLKNQKENEPLPVRHESPGSIHILFKLRGSLVGLVDAEPMEAFTARKKANAKMREKNSKATSCGYIVKSVKLSE